ncbi:hypothetical protein HET69_17425 [Streptomyces sp. CJ_13]|uniref:enolase C-terminal domain-like protein n=1 Tax=Streptomyces sp. CJ_13 TaxID=2724943 RepID=UPI001BDC55E2|nr:hypothetical protein [Streptomyces sp. CJ_13]
MAGRPRGRARRSCRTPAALVWLEDPAPTHDPRAYRQLRTLPPAVGERLTLADDVPAVLAAIRPAALTLDVVGCGGLTAGRAQGHCACARRGTRTSAGRSRPQTCRSSCPPRLTPPCASGPYASPPLGREGWFGLPQGANIGASRGRVSEESRRTVVT